MANNNKESNKEEIKSRCSIVDVIGQVVTLKKMGANYKGLCPFHNEKTPSFVVSEEKQVFTCFGCGASGDVISFVQKYYNLDFKETMEKLGRQCGLTFETGRGKSIDKEIYYEINREAAKFFYKNLRQKENPAIEYMLKRGLSYETLKEFGIGYTGDNWDSLYKHLTSLGYEPKKLEELGLISNSKGKYYDKFRRRVIFPILNTNGRVIGFGGRALGDDSPKYLNSQETPVFKKKYNLYGINLSRKDIGRENLGILVEGYMDVISLYQGGIKNVTASLGTALTENQARMLKRYSQNIIISYDSDDAGKKATYRGLEILHREGCKAKVLTIPEGKDPDDYIKQKGKSAYLQLVEKAQTYGDYRFSVLSERYNLNTTDGRIEFLKEAVLVLKSLRPVEADLYIKKLASDYHISEGAIRAEYGNLNQESQKPIRVNNQKDFFEIPLQEKNLIKILITDSSFIKKEELEEYFQSIPAKEIYKNILNIYSEGEEIDVEKLFDMLEDRECNILRDIEENIILGGNEEQVFIDCIERLSLEQLKSQENTLIAALSMADEEDNKEAIINLTEQLMAIQQRIRVGGKDFEKNNK